jgi:hypothetical protein
VGSYETEKGGIPLPVVPMEETGLLLGHHGGTGTGLGMRGKVEIMVVAAENTKSDNGDNNYAQPWIYIYIYICSWRLFDNTLIPLPVCH